MTNLTKLTAADKYEIVFDAFCEAKKMTFNKEHLMDIWDVHIESLWNLGFDGIFGYSHQNEFLTDVLVTRVRKHKKWLLANGGENLVMTVYFYKDEIKALN